MIKVWEDKSPYKQLFKLNGHTASTGVVYQMKNKEILISSARDNTIRFWNLDTKEKIHVINGKSCFNIKGIKEIKDKILIVFGNVMIINSITLQIETIYDYKDIFINTLIDLNDGTFLCGAGWNTGNPKTQDHGVCLRINDKEKKIMGIIDKVDNNRIMALALLDNHTLLTGCANGLAKVWKL